MTKRKPKKQKDRCEVCFQETPPFYVIHSYNICTICYEGVKKIMLAVVHEYEQILS